VERKVEDAVLDEAAMADRARQRNTGAEPCPRCGAIGDHLCPTSLLAKEKVGGAEPNPDMPFASNDDISKVLTGKK
jgi:hypothetical protein